MNDAPPLPNQDTDRRWRRRARIGLLTLFPTAVVAWLPVLMSERFARCISYRDECAAGYNILASVAWYAFWGSAAAGVAAMVVTSTADWARRLRKSLVLSQLMLQITAATAIVAQA
jgi:hypothetical protein